MNPIRLLPLGPTHWLNTQSVYHALAETMTADSPDTIILAQPLQPYLCVGYHQDVDSVLDRAACAAMNLPIVRRRVGGGATYLDVNQLFYQCIFHHTRVPAMINDVYARLLAAPIAALRRLGLNAELRGENEIEILPEPSPRRRASPSVARDFNRRATPNDKRIAGIGGGRIGEAAVVVGNILLDFDYNAMVRAWRVPSEAFRQLASEAIRERVTTLWGELPRPISPDEIQGILIEEFARALGRPVEYGQSTQQEIESIQQVEKRLTSDEWLNLHADGGQPMTALKISRGVFIRAVEGQFSGSTVRAALRVREGVIEQAALEGQPHSDWREAEQRLRGKQIGEWLNALATEHP